MRKTLHFLVTGASGFVGQAFVHRLLVRGHQVTTLVRARTSAPKGAEALVHDLGCGTVPKLPEGIFAVAHLAQSRAYRNSPLVPVRCFASMSRGRMSC